MLDIKLIREQTEKVKKGVESKGYSVGLVDKVLDIDQRRRVLIQEIDDLRAKANEAASKRDVEQGKALKNQIQEKEPNLEKIQKEYEIAINGIPNLPLESVPVGKGEEDNKEIKKVGEAKKFDFEPRDHVVLGQNLGILDFEGGAKIAGSGFYYLINEGALLELALVRFAMDLLVKEGFVPIVTPDLAKSRFYLGTGYQPKGDEAQTYAIEGEDLGLIATAEVALAGKTC